MKDFIIEKGNFTTTQNDIFRAEINGKKLSPEAWGLYVFMLSLPDTWDYTIMGLTYVVNAGKNKIQRMLKELETAGFIKRYQENKNGVFGKMQYAILESPKIETVKDNETLDNNEPYPRKPLTEKPSTANQPQQSTNKQNTNKQSKDIDKLMIKGEIPPVIASHYLTKELINKKFISALDYDLKDYDNLFYELDNNFSYDLVLASTRYLVDTMSKDKDAYGCKYSYFKKSIYTNLNMLEKQAKNNDKNIPDFFKDYLQTLDN